MVCGDTVLLDFWSGFAEIVILSCNIAVLQFQAVCGIQKFSGNFNAVFGFLILFCAVIIHASLRFCSFRIPLTPPPPPPPLSVGLQAYAYLTHDVQRHFTFKTYLRE